MKKAISVSPYCETRYGHTFACYLCLTVTQWKPTVTLSTGMFDWHK